MTFTRQAALSAESQLSPPESVRPAENQFAPPKGGSLRRESPSDPLWKGLRFRRLLRCRVPPGVEMNDAIRPHEVQPCSALLLHRDYFGRLNASLFSFFSPQGLFRPTECIPVFLFFTTGITLPRTDASLSCSFAPQGLFRPTECIPVFLFFTTRIISPGQMHPYPALLFHRDYFGRSDKSHR